MDKTLFLADNQMRYTNHLCNFSVSDGKKLLSNDRQHFNINPVKLIKTAPGPGLRQSREEPSHHLEVQPLGAVEYHALFRKGFG